VNATTIAVGQELTPMTLDVTATVIVAGALATRDFMPVHHDKAYANAQGAPDIFMNILSSNAYCSRFLTDWAGPEAMLRKLSIRLGVPVFPGVDLTFAGHVTGVTRATADVEVTVEFRATSDLGTHLSGTAALALR
jgi:acyl dehydratase